MNLHHRKKTGPLLITICWGPLHGHPDGEPKVHIKLRDGFVVFFSPTEAREIGARLIAAAEGCDSTLTDGQVLANERSRCRAIDAKNGLAGVTDDKAFERFFPAAPKRGEQ